MRKKIAVAIILVMYILSNISIFATSALSSGTGESLSDLQKGVEADNFNSLMESGTVSTNGKTRQENVPVNTQSNENLNMIFGLLCKVLIAIPYVSNTILSQITTDGKEPFTIYKTITNQYDLFDVSLLVKNEQVDYSVDNILVPIAKNIAIWFIGIRNLSIVIIVVMIIYVGIRMAIATVSTKKANYKKMLFGWVEGVLLIFTLHIFIILMIFVSNWLVGVFMDVAELDPEITTMEERIMTNIDENLEEAHNSYGTIYYTILYIVFSYYKFKFFILYMGRLMRIAFYTIISPLVCVTIPMDKVGDGKAQAFGKWILEFCITTFMQPMHLLIYIVTMYSIGEILVRNPVMGIAFLVALSYSERTFKSVLKLKPVLGKGLKDIKLKSLVGGEEE